MPEPASRKCGATISRSICWSLLLASAKTAQSPLEFWSLASTSMRLTMPSGPGAVDTWKFSPWSRWISTALERSSATSSREILIGSTAAGRRAGEHRRQRREGKRQKSPAPQSDDFKKISPVSSRLGRSPRDQRVEIMILPHSVDSQVGSQQSLAPESGFFKQAQRAKVVRKTGCLDPVQPQASRTHGKTMSPSASSISPRPA